MRYEKDREDEFLAELRELYYRYYGASLAEIDPMQLIREGFQLIYSMNLRLPTRFLLLDKAIATLGAVGVELYPDFNVFEVAQPYARDARARAVHAAADAAARAAGRDALAQRRSARRRTSGTTSSSRSRDGQIEVGFVHKGLDEFLRRRSSRVFNRLVIALVVAGGLIGSALIGVFAKSGPHVLGLNALSVVGFVALRRARRLAALGRRPLRPAVDESSHFRAKGHLARADACGYRRRNDSHC